MKMFNSTIGIIFGITIMLIVLMTVGTLVLAVKGCDYITSGKAAEHIEQIVDEN
jgi:hypothetical protein